ncbi:MAG: amidohydrolase family protein [Bacteroidales bacterium]|nr:amidohydrolase family protein [Bacteroidales bacterium]
MRRLSAHYIFPVDRPPLKNGIVEVDDNGTILNIIDTKGKNKETASTEFYNGILIPGFINTHCHLELSYLKGKITPRQGLAKFIEDLKNVRAGESPEIIAAKADFFDKLMWQNGIVAVGDISNNTVSFPIKKKSKIHYHSFLEFFGLSTQNAEKVYAANREKLQALKLFDLKGNLTPHAPYSIAPTLFNKFKQDSHTPGEIISIHFQETGSENTYFNQQSGNIFDLFKKWEMPYPYKKPYSSSINFILSHLPPDLNTIFVHNTFAAENDVLKIKETIKNPFFCLCPNANMYIENQLPDILLLKNSGIPLTLGTDSLASNHSLSILEEMKTLQQNLPELDLNEIIKWATLNGATALKIDNTFGSISENKKSGINLVENLDLENLRLLPGTIVRKLI